ncbi:MAG: hypothetical protein LBV67_09645 [Streptococcaceae bacterium]|jgi:hypothetical protein|nr:hypothetical protein [Streptococcaceae bacterium]
MATLEKIKKSVEPSNTKKEAHEAVKQANKKRQEVKETRKQSVKNAGKKSLSNIRNLKNKDELVNYLESNAVQALQEWQKEQAIDVMNTQLWTVGSVVRIMENQEFAVYDLEGNSGLFYQGYEDVLLIMTEENIPVYVRQTQGNIWQNGNLANDAGKYFPVKITEFYERKDGQIVALGSIKDAQYEMGIRLWKKWNSNKYHDEFKTTKATVKSISEDFVVVSLNEHGDYTTVITNENFGGKWRTRDMHDFFKLGQRITLDIKKIEEVKFNERNNRKGLGLTGTYFLVEVEYAKYNQYSKENVYKLLKTTSNNQNVVFPAFLLDFDMGRNYYRVEIAPNIVIKMNIPKELAWNKPKSEELKQHKMVMVKADETLNFTLDENNEFDFINHSHVTFVSKPA